MATLKYKGQRWDAWVFKHPIKSGDPEEKWKYTLPVRTPNRKKPSLTRYGKWVKVKFVEVN